METGEHLADDSFRGMNGHHTVKHARWISGPGFLTQSETDWPKQLSLLNDLQHSEHDKKLYLSTVLC